MAFKSALLYIMCAFAILFLSVHRTVNLLLESMAGYLDVTVSVILLLSNLEQ